MASSIPSAVITPVSSEPDRSRHNDKSTARARTGPPRIVSVAVNGKGEMISTGFIYSPYGWLMLCGIAVSFLFWWRLAMRDSKLVFIYLSALGGAFIGAKLVYLAAE